MSNVNNMLDLLKHIPKQSSTSYNGYNIFEVLGVEYSEVIVCRFIGNLLDPKGSHGLGDKPLRWFICDVLGDKILEDNLTKTEIILEAYTYNDRRIDIVISSTSKIYPIEVKIWAGDQYRQLEDYYSFCFGESVDNKIYYLTPDGKEPSYESRGNLSEAQISCISFSKRIKHWLEKIQKTAPENIKFIIENFMEVIDKMSKQSVELNEILKALELNNNVCDSENIKSAVLLLKHRDEIWTRIRENYLRKILIPGKYTLENCKGDEVDSHALMYVVKDKKIIARICVATNLYIVTKKNSDVCVSGWTEYNTDYQWQYINVPNKSQHIKLNTPIELRYDIEINLAEILRDVEQSLLSGNS